MIFSLPFYFICFLFLPSPLPPSFSAASSFFFFIRSHDSKMLDFPAWSSNFLSCFLTVSCASFWDTSSILYSSHLFPWYFIFQLHFSLWIMYFPALWEVFSSLHSLCGLQVAFFLAACLDLCFHVDALLNPVVVWGYLLLWRSGAVERHLEDSCVRIAGWVCECWGLT